MTLAEAASPIVVGPRCRLGAFLDGLTDDDRAGYDALVDVARTDWPDWRVRDLLADTYGHRTSTASISRHRSGACVCDRKDHQ